MFVIKCPKNGADSIIIIFSISFFFQIYTVDLNNPDDCGSKFRSNRNLGLLFWFMIMAGNLLREEKGTENRHEKKKGN